MEKCTTICNFPGDPDGAGSGTAVACTGDSSLCAADLCDTTGFSAGCVATLDEMLDCMLTATPERFYCAGDPELIAIDYVGAYDCSASFNDWALCIAP